MKRLAFLGGGITAVSTLAWLAFEGAKVAANSMTNVLNSLVHR